MATRKIGFLSQTRTTFVPASRGVCHSSRSLAFGVQCLPTPHRKPLIFEVFGAFLSFFEAKKIKILPFGKPISQRLDLESAATRFTLDHAKSRHKKINVNRLVQSKLHDSKTGNQNGCATNERHLLYSPDLTYFTVHVSLLFSAP